MRNCFAMLACFVLFLSCKKERFTLYDKYSGKWELAYLSSFWFNRTYPPGNGNFMVLGKDGNFKRISADTIRFQGPYSLENKMDCLGEGKKIHLKTNDSADFAETTLIIRNDSLIRDPPNCWIDAPTYIYRRVE